MRKQTSILIDHKKFPQKGKKMAYQFSGSPKISSSGNPASPSLNKNRSGRENNWLRGLVTLLIIIVVVGAGIYLISSYTGISLPGGSSLDLKNEWQAVFLTNGQIYFGKVAKVSSDWVVLRNIYYLQVISQPLQRSQEGENPAAEAQPEQRLTLIKLGNEIHGPRDEMAIDRRQVILIEDLRNDGKVVQAINQYIKEPNQPQALQPAAPTPQP